MPDTRPADPYVDVAEPRPHPPRSAPAIDAPAPKPPDELVAREVARVSPEAKPAAPWWTRRQTFLVIAIVLLGVSVLAAIAGFVIGWAVAAAAFLIGCVAILVNPQTWASLKRGKEDEEAAARVARRSGIV